MEINRTEICVAMRGRNLENPSDRTAGAYLEQRLEANTQGKTNCLTTVSKDNLIMERKPIQLNHSDKEFGNQPRQQNRVYDEEGISPEVMVDISCGSHAVFNRCRIRRLTPTECARLQSIPDWYEWKGKFPDGKVKPTSDTQIYKMCGNGWNVEVIKHIFSFIDLEAYEKVRKTNDKKE